MLGQIAAKVKFALTFTKMDGHWYNYIYIVVIICLDKLEFVQVSTKSIWKMSDVRLLWYFMPCLKMHTQVYVSKMQFYFLIVMQLI